MLDTTNKGVGQDSVSSQVQAILREQSVLAGVFYDVSMFAMAGDKSISFPRNTNRFNVEKLTGATAGTSQELVIDLDKLDLDQEAHIQWVIKKFDQARSKVEILQNAIENAAGEHAIQLDNDLAAELVANLDAGNILPGNPAISRDSLVDLKTLANTKRIPRANRRWVIGNEAMGSVQKIDGFIEADKSNMDIVRTGQLGVLFGYPVFESDVVEADHIMLTHRDAIAFGFGAAPELEDQKAIEYGTGSRRWVMDALYGVKTLNEGKMAVLLDPSA